MSERCLLRGMSGTPIFNTSHGNIRIEVQKTLILFVLLIPGVLSHISEKLHKLRSKVRVWSGRLP